MSRKTASQKRVKKDDILTLGNMIADINQIIVKYAGVKITESERDDLCNIRWMLENKKNGVVYVKDGDNIWLESGNKCS